MIIMLGQGWLYQIHRNKIAMLTQMEKRRAFLLMCAIMLTATTGVFLWILH